MPAKPAILTHNTEESDYHSRHRRIGSKDMYTLDKTLMLLVCLLIQKLGLILIYLVDNRLASNEIVTMQKCVFYLKNFIGSSLLGSQFLEFLSIQYKFSILSIFTMSNNIITSFSKSLFSLRDHCGSYVYFNV